jgi:exopolysaccharide biosynthesis polyprenyl glycosylphosphotransferase
MIRRHATALRLSLAAVDFLSAVIVFVGVSIFRFGPAWQEAWEAAAADPGLLAVLYGAAWVSILWLQGLYRLRARWSWRTEWTDLLRAVLLIAFLMFAFLFVAKLPNVSRLFLLWLFAAQAVVAIASRGLLRYLFARARESGRNARYVLIVGDGPGAHDFAGRLERNAYLGLRVVGFLADPRRDDPRPGDASVVADAPPARRRAPAGTLGRIGDIEAVLRSTVVDEVAICLPPEHGEFVEPIARLCEEEGLVVRVPLLEGGTAIPGGRLEDFEGIRLQSLVYGPDRALGLIAKRGLDIVGGIAGLVIFSPVLVGAAIAIRRDGPGPIFFRQVRVGLRGRQFQVVKFRTMIPDAEEQLEELLAHNEIRGHAFKLTDDPRVTRVGRFLRRTSLDEIPQFWNVLRGEMSLVGPRPPLPEEVADYDVWHRRRLSMKPGATGLWQVSARREEDFDRWVRIDLDYIDRWSLWLDLKIILRTVPAMLQGR